MILTLSLMIIPTKTQDILSGLMAAVVVVVTLIAVFVAELTDWYEACYAWLHPSDPQDMTKETSHLFHSSPSPLPYPYSHLHQNVFKPLDL